MKKISKILAGLLSAIAIGSIAIVPMDASALAKLLGYDSNGKEIYGGYFDELVGFDEDGNPIIVNTDPSITIATATPPLPEVEQTTEESQVNTVAEKKIEIPDVSNNLENDAYIIINDTIVIIQDSDNNVISKYYFKVDYEHGAIARAKIGDTFDVSQAKKIITISDKNATMYVDFKTYYAPLVYVEEEEKFLIQDKYIFKDTTIGDSENKPITEITVGDSTFPRGDINLDGKVNTVDLLMLKKYLLGLMEW